MLPTAGTYLLCSCVLFLCVLGRSVSENSCEKLDLSDPIGDNQNVTVNGWLNLTFWLNTETCADQIYMVSIDVFENPPVNLCKIQQNKTLCVETDSVNFTMSCRCRTPSGPVEFFKKMEQPGEVVFRWRWRAVGSKNQSERTIKVHAGNATREEQTDKTLSYIMAGASGFLLLVVLVVSIFARCLGTSHCGTSTRNSKPETLGNTQPGADKSPPASTSCSRQDTKDDLPLANEDVYSRLWEHTKKTQADKPRAHRQPVEMIINVFYEHTEL